MIPREHPDPAFLPNLYANGTVPQEEDGFASLNNQRNAERCKPLQRDIYISSLAALARIAQQKQFFRIYAVPKQKVY